MIDPNNCIKPELPASAIVACQGVEGAYSQIAASAAFAQPDIMYMRTFDGVFRAVDKGLCQYGMLPVENSNAGTVADVYDLMKVYNFYIVRGVKVSISHMLLSKEKLSAEKIKAVYSHEQAVKQCSRFLEENPHIKVNYCANTAAAARMVAESADKGIAAIASESCARLYGLTVSARNVQNNDNNYTRFICISKECEIFANSDKISLMITLEHKAGSLYETIKHFAGLGLNLTKLESRPIAGTDFEFMFYFDFQASITDTDVYNLLLRLEKEARQIVFLGNYREITA
ncbi:MAG: bifunctional chorismate mutase/prephenate dehydratase [Chitinispirillia bacterium]|nr:bifunctional chorismate mutase/prephenate dehydratase [Chitinispirillia bacterium]